jgi:hypothetical protein
MTNDFAIPPQTWLHTTNDYIDEIHDIFYQHWVSLNNERQESIGKIKKWRVDQKQQINKFADEQTALLDDDYNRLRRIFDETHKENLETANAYHDTRQLDLFNELRDACRLLQFQAATLIFCKYEMDRPRVIIVEKKLERKNVEEINANIRNDARRRRRQNKDNNNNTENSSDTTASPALDLSTTNSKQTKCVCTLKHLSLVVLSIFIFSDHHTSKTKPKKQNEQPAAKNDDSKSQVTNGDEPNNKCPICFMIFPLSMISSDRHQHVNEHMVDDLDTNDT